MLTVKNKGQLDLNDCPCDESIHLRRRKLAYLILTIESKACTGLRWIRSLSHQWQNSNPFEQTYQEMIDSGILPTAAPVPVRFRYPTARISVPTFTTYGIQDTPKQGEKCVPNWRQILSEINSEVVKHRQKSNSSSDLVRRRYLRKLNAKTKRNVIAYYSGWLSKPNIAGTDIVDEDKNGLMMAIHQLDKNAGLDLILHTPGGYIATAKFIVDYLKRIFGKNIRAIVPQISMSAGTMIACSCSTIVMGKHSNLGPIDPQLNGVPAAGVLEEFKTAYLEMKADPDTRAVWEHILKQYPPSFLGQCDNAVKWARLFCSAS